MKLKLILFLFACHSVTLLAGCGGGATGGSDPKNTLAESLTCIACHEGTHGGLTPGSQQPVDIEWKASTHNTQNGASCPDCHGSGYLHTSTAASCSGCHSISGQAVNPIKNPDANGKCSNCHDKINPRPSKSDGYTAVTGNGIPANSTTRFTHFSSGTRTNYVSSSYRQNCRKCHNPHNTAFGREQRQAWTDSGHGNTRGMARTALDAKTRGTRLSLDQNTANNNYCVRCHTSTGFINFVKNDTFTDVNALPDTNGFQSNAPEFTTSAGVIKDQAGTVFTYKDTSREATNCDVCHVDSHSVANSSSYSGELRRVAISSGVKIYYPYASAPASFNTVTPVQFDTLGSSNLCLTCHSGRATGQTIKTPGLNFTLRPAAPSIHDFAGGAVLQGEKSAFLFYTSPLKYVSVPAHRRISTDGNGPCISCHMPKVQSAQPGGGVIHSHLFRPVVWNKGDNNDVINDIISYPSVCVNCHSGGAAAFTAKMNELRNSFRLSLLILNKLIVPTTASPGVLANDWTVTNPNTGVTYGNAQIAVLGGMNAGGYSMGANYNYGFLFNEPSAYNHSPILARQLIYDSIDWLVNGPNAFGTNPANVYAAMKAVPIPAGGFVWSKADPIAGAILGTNATQKPYSTFTTEADRELAFIYLCKNYVSGSNVCNRVDGKP